ncbi:MAG: PKD domain-containing protein [Solirubrobacteraceae bacterium]
MIQRPYAWGFGDGSATVSGVAPRHTYRIQGTYLVTLTVLYSAGLRASRSMWLTVALDGRITRISAQTSRHGTFLMVELNAPGRLSVGSRTSWSAGRSNAASRSG